VYNATHTLTTQEQQMALDKAKIAEAIEYLNRANALQQEANIDSEADEDVSYKIHSAIEDAIETLESFL
jgi:hypothetical protein